jgi:uncharacterized protein
MLPQFPEFKKLELSDCPAIEAVTSKYAPYSDYNFKEMWTWDVHSSLCFSGLNGNLVLDCRDYKTRTEYLSFLGDNQVPETVSLIFEHLSRKGQVDALRSIPEISLKGLDFSKYTIDVDFDNSDYIFDLNKLAKYEGSEYKKKRAVVSKFLRLYGQPEIVEINLTQQDNKDKIQNLSQLWGSNKTGSNKIKNNLQPGLDSVPAALNKFLAADFPDTLCLGVVINGKLVGYSICSLVQFGYAMCHFSMADISYSGIYEFLMRETAAFLLGKGCELFNYQEDLGITNLRFSKDSYNPVAFLRKCVVKPVR